MFSLQGSNVKLSCKPVTPTKKKANLAKREIKGRIVLDNKDSTEDSDSGVGLGIRKGTNRRRISSSATLPRETTTMGKSSKARPTFRKLSQPEPVVNFVESAFVTLTKEAGPKRRFSMSATSTSKVDPEECPGSAETDSKPNLILQPFTMDKKHASEIPSHDNELGFEVSRPSSLDDNDNISPELELLSYQLELDDQPETETDFASRESEQSNYDKLLLAESDNLIQDVVTLCNEMGIDSSAISATKSNSNRSKSLDNHGNRNTKLENEPNTNTNSINQRELDELLSSRNESSSSISQTPRADIKLELQPDNLNTYNRIISTLRLIEEDEAKTKTMFEAAQFQEFQQQNFSSKTYSSSPRNSSRNNSTMDHVYFYKSPPISRPMSPGTNISQNHRKKPGEGSSFTEIRFKQHNGRVPPVSPRIISSCSTSDIPSAGSSPRSRFSHHHIISSSDLILNGRPSSPTPGGLPSQFYSEVQFEEVAFRPKSAAAGSYTTEDSGSLGQQKSRNIHSFLDEVEKSDREILFHLKFDTNSNPSDFCDTSTKKSSSSYSNAGVNNGMPSHNFTTGNKSNDGAPVRTMDSLIRKGSVELAKEILLLERKLEDTVHSVRVLEDTLLSQRELNMRNLKNSEKDLKKRLKIQQDEFELALSRHQTFVDQLIAEKRSIQDKCEKVLKESKETEGKYHDQMKSVQQKHLEEIKRLRKIQVNGEKAKKQKWLGTKTQEIREMTVKGLEPEVQRIIQRHQQEMAEMRAWHADEIHEIEDRYARKQAVNLQEMRESFSHEKEEVGRRERDAFQHKLKSELERCRQELESQRQKLNQEFQDQKNHLVAERDKLRETMQGDVRKAEIKGEVEIENLQQEHDKKLQKLEKRHEDEVRSLKDVFEAEKDNLILKCNAKHEQSLRDQHTLVLEAFKEEKHKEIADREKKLKEELEKLRKEDEDATEARIKRMQEKFQFELAELEKSEIDLKQKLSSLKTDVLAKDEEIFGFKTTLAQREKQNHELTQSNMKMVEERVNLTSVIRREFTTQIETLEEDCRMVKSAVLELKTKHKLDLEARQLGLERSIAEKDNEMDKVMLRVKQTLAMKEETLQELQNQLEKTRINCSHLETLLEQQRQEFVASLTKGSLGLGGKSKKK